MCSLFPLANSIISYPFISSMYYQLPPFWQCFVICCIFLVYFQQFSWWNRWILSPFFCSCLCSFFFFLFHLLFPFVHFTVINYSLSIGLSKTLSKVLFGLNFSSGWFWKYLDIMKQSMLFQVLNFHGVVIIVVKMHV